MEGLRTQGQGQMFKQFEGWAFMSLSCWLRYFKYILKLNPVPLSNILLWKDLKIDSFDKNMFAIAGPDNCCDAKIGYMLFEVVFACVLERNNEVNIKMPLNLFCMCTHVQDVTKILSTVQNHENRTSICWYSCTHMICGAI